MCSLSIYRPDLYALNPNADPIEKPKKRDTKKREEMSDKMLQLMMNLRRKTTVQLLDIRKEKELAKVEGEAYERAIFGLHGLKSGKKLW